MSTSFTSDSTIIHIGISSCLLGNRVRYDGDHQYLPIIEQVLCAPFHLIPFCPEVDIGLGVPREKIQLVEKQGEIFCLDQPTYKIDFTQKLKDSCDQQASWLDKISGYLFKTKSPSCGLTKVKTDRDGSLVADGQGIFATRLQQRYPDLPLIEEDSFQIADARQAFLDRVREFHYRRQSRQGAT